MRTLRLATVAAALLAVAACGTEKSDPTGPGTGGPEVLIGRVIGIDDQTPVDGGLTIEVIVEGDGGDWLLLPSLFTSPPPGEDLQRLYDLARRVEPGDRVRARGTRNEAGLQLEELWILEGSLEPLDPAH